MWAIRDILEEFSDRAMNVGIYEDAMVSIAAGMAHRGLIPTIFGIQPYLIERTLEQIKMDLVYQKSGVNIIGTGAAVDYSKYGYSHYCPEDAALIKMFPGTEFIAPGTAKQFLQLFDTAYRNGHPSFFRISDHPNSKYNCDVIFGRAEIIQRGTKATIIAVSVLLDMVMEACAGEDVTVLYYTTLEPFDGAALAENCSSGKVLVCEPHFSGTLDHDILEALKDRTVQIAHAGFPREIFRNYGTYEEKILHYGLTAENIKTKIKILLSQ
jgi:transketolase